MVGKGAERETMRVLLQEAARLTETIARRTLHGRRSKKIFHLTRVYGVDFFSVKRLVQQFFVHIGDEKNKVSEKNVERSRKRYAEIFFLFGEMH